MPHGFTTTLLIASGNANQSTVAQIVQSELKPLGITVNIQQLDPTARARRLGGRQLPDGLLRLDHGHPRPGRVDLLRGGPQRRRQVGLHQLQQPDGDQPQQAGRAADRPGQAGGLYTQLQQQTSKDAFLAYLYYPPYAYATTDNVHGFFVTPLGNFHLEDVYKTS